MIDSLGSRVAAVESAEFSLRQARTWQQSPRSSTQSSLVSLHPTLPFQWKTRQPHEWLLPKQWGSSGVGVRAASHWAAVQVRGHRSRPFDCSGLVQWAYQQVGVTLTRTTYTEYTTDPINNKGIANEPGDLLFIPGSDAIGVLPGHVMMYVSPGQVFQAEQTGTKIGQFSYPTDQWEYRSRPALSLPFAPAAPLPPPPDRSPWERQRPRKKLAQTNLVPMKNVAQATQAMNNGWVI